MKKYDLVMGDTFLYSKEIPNRALNLIEGFSEEISNRTERLSINEKLYDGDHDGLSIDEYDKQVESHYRYQASLLYGFSKRKLVDLTISPLKMVAPINHFEIPYVRIRGRREVKDKVLPLFYLDKNNRQLRFNQEKIEEASRQMREVLDPIACLSVEGGYIIIDAWDKEANIPEIKNSNLN